MPRTKHTGGLAGFRPSVHGQWFYLFHALIILLVVYPYLETPAEEIRPWPVALINSVVILSIIYAASESRLQFVGALILGIPTLIFYWLPQLPYDEAIALLFTVLLYLYAMFLIFRKLLSTHEVGSEEIYGATSLYILLGLVWAALYQGIEWAYPGSFYVAAEQNLDATMTWSDFQFFSFTTLTTLGYGDITPITSQARSLAIIEAITGVIFVAAMISGAIGVYVSQRLIKLKDRLCYEEKRQNVMREQIEHLAELEREEIEELEKLRQERRE